MEPTFLGFQKGVVTKFVDQSHKKAPSWGGTYEQVWSTRDYVLKDISTFLEEHTALHGVLTSIRQEAGDQNLLMAKLASGENSLIGDYLESQEITPLQALETLEKIKAQVMQSGHYGKDVTEAEVNDFFDLQEIRIFTEYAAMVKNENTVKDLGCKSGNPDIDCKDLSLHFGEDLCLAINGKKTTPVANFTVNDFGSAVINEFNAAAGQEVSAHDKILVARDVIGERLWTLTSQDQNFVLNPFGQKVMSIINTLQFKDEKEKTFMTSFFNLKDVDPMGDFTPTISSKQAVGYINKFGAILQEKRGGAFKQQDIDNFILASKVKLLTDYVLINPAHESQLESKRQTK